MRYLTLTNRLDLPVWRTGHCCESSLEAAGSSMSVHTYIYIDRVARLLPFVWLGLAKSWASIVAYTLHMHAFDSAPWGMCLNAYFFYEDCFWQLSAQTGEKGCGRVWERVEAEQLLAQVLTSKHEIRTELYARRKAWG